MHHTLETVSNSCDFTVIYFIWWPFSNRHATWHVGERLGLSLTAVAQVLTTVSLKIFISCIYPGLESNLR